MLRVTWRIFEKMPKMSQLIKTWATSVMLNELSKVNNRPIDSNSPNLGSMLWSHFSAIFTKFLRKKLCVFLRNQCYDHICAKFEQKTLICSQFFFNRNIGHPEFSHTDSQALFVRSDWGSWKRHFFLFFPFQNRHLNWMPDWPRNAVESFVSNIWDESGAARWFIFKPKIPIWVNFVGL
jgi:hypothetical protein